MKIGILALQGAFLEHKQMLDRLGADSVYIRQLADLTDEIDAVIIPGGESTVIGKLLDELGLMQPLRDRIEAGMPVFGTCAGLILLAQEISNDTHVYLGTMRITAKRNAYGRQLGSFETTARLDGVGEMPLVFIRAPYVERAEDGVKILCSVDEKIVAVRQDNQLATAFHPELTRSKLLHIYFLNMVRAYLRDRAEA